jgi:type II secretory pathway pseudopilin PulG
MAASIEALIEEQHKAMYMKENHWLNITGPERSGKTTHLLAACHKLPTDVDILWLDLTGVTNEREAIAQACIQLGLAAAPDDLSGFVVQFRLLLQGLKSGSVVVFDNFDGRPLVHQSSASTTTVSRDLVKMKGHMKNDIMKNGVMHSQKLEEQQRSSSAVNRQQLVQQQRQLRNLRSFIREVVIGVGREFMYSLTIVTVGDALISAVTSTSTSTSTTFHGLVGDSTAEYTRIACAREITIPGVIPSSTSTSATTSNTTFTSTSFGEYEKIIRGILGVVGSGVHNSSTNKGGAGDQMTVALLMQRR